MATICMLLLKPRCLNGVAPKGYMKGILLGLILGTAYVFQTYGLLYVSAAVSGFITGMFVVFTPLISWLILKKRITLSTWVAVILAGIGLAALSLRGWAMGKGELFTLICALFVAIHIVGLGEWSVEYKPYGFTVIQLGTIAIVSSGIALLDGFSLPPDPQAWLSIILTGILATALAFLVQTWAQSIARPTPVAVVLTMEPVFAGVFGVALAGNVVTTRMVIGALCILTGMLLVQITDKTPNKHNK